MRYFLDFKEFKKSFFCVNFSLSVPNLLFSAFIFISFTRSSFKICFLMYILYVGSCGRLGKPAKRLYERRPVSANSALQLSFHRWKLHKPKHSNRTARLHRAEGATGWYLGHFPLPRRRLLCYFAQTRVLLPS